MEKMDEAELARNVERKIFELQAQLISADSTDAKLFQECKRWFQMKHFQEVAEERVVSGLCGFPLCEKELDSSNNNRGTAARFAIHYRTRSLKEIEENASNFCSADCFQSFKSIEETLEPCSSVRRSVVKSLKFPPNSDRTIDNLLQILADKSRTVSSDDPDANSYLKSTKLPPFQHPRMTSKGELNPRGNAERTGRPPTTRPVGRQDSGGVDVAANESREALREGAAEKNVASKDVSEVAAAGRRRMEKLTTDDDFEALMNETESMDEEIEASELDIDGNSQTDLSGLHPSQRPVYHTLSSATSTPTKPSHRGTTLIPVAAAGSIAPAAAPELSSPLPSPRRPADESTNTSPATRPAPRTHKPTRNCVEWTVTERSPSDSITSDVLRASPPPPVTAAASRFKMGKVRRSARQEEEMARRPSRVHFSEEATSAAADAVSGSRSGLPNNKSHVVQPVVQEKSSPAVMPESVILNRANHNSQEAAGTAASTASSQAGFSVDGYCVPVRTGNSSSDLNTNNNTDSNNDNAFDPVAALSQFTLQSPYPRESAHPTDHDRAVWKEIFGKDFVSDDEASGDDSSSNWVEEDATLESARSTRLFVTIWAGLDDLFGDIDLSGILSGRVLSQPPNSLGGSRPDVDPERVVASQIQQQLFSRGWSCAEELLEMNRILSSHSSARAHYHTVKTNLQNEMGKIDGSESSMPSLTSSEWMVLGAVLIESIIDFNDALRALHRKYVDDDDVGDAAADQATNSTSRWMMKFHGILLRALPPSCNLSVDDLVLLKSYFC